MKTGNSMQSQGGRVILLLTIWSFYLIGISSVKALVNLESFNVEGIGVDTFNLSFGRVESTVNQEAAKMNLLGERVWFAGAETGNFSEWDWTGTMDPQNSVFFGTTTELARSGNRSFKIEVDAGGGKRASNMMFLTRDNNVLMKHEDLIYTVWFYIPQRVQFTNTNGAPWHNIMQFKMRDEFDRGDPIFTLGFDPWDNNRPNYIQLRNAGEWFPGGTSFNYPQIQNIPVPLGQWFKLQVRYKRSSNNTGRITVWQNDVLIYDINNVITYPSVNNRGGRAKRLEWSVNNYTRNTIPSITAVYVDDAAIHLPDVNTTPAPSSFNLQLNSNPSGAGKVKIKN